MAGYAIKKSKLAGSSILEVVVAMVVIVTVLGISMMIYTNVMRLSLSAQRLRANAVLQDTITKIENGKIEKEEEPDKGWQLVKEIKPYEEGTHLYIVHLTLYDQNQEKLAELSKIIIHEEAP